MREVSLAMFAICLIARWDHVNSKSMAVRKLPYIPVPHYSHSSSSASHNSKSCNCCSIPKIFMQDILLELQAHFVKHTGHLVCHTALRIPVTCRKSWRALICLSQLSTLTLPKVQSYAVLTHQLSNFPSAHPSWCSSFFAVAIILFDSAL